MKLLTKFDYILIVVIMLSAVSIYFTVTNQLKEKVTAGSVTVYYKNNIYETIDIANDGLYHVSTELGDNDFEIKDGIVNMIDATCKDKLCIHEQSIEYNNQNIVCLPNKVVIKIQSTKQSELDGVVR